MSDPIQKNISDLRYIKRTKESSNVLDSCLLELHRQCILNLLLISAVFWFLGWIATMYKIIHPSKKDATLWINWLIHRWKYYFSNLTPNYCIEQCKQRQYFEDSSSWLFLKNLGLTSLGCPLVYLVTRCCHLILLIHMIWLKEIQLYQIFCHILETATDCSVTINNSSYKTKKNMKVHFWDKIAQQSLWLCKNVLFVVIQERFTWNLILKFRWISCKFILAMFSLQEIRAAKKVCSSKSFLSYP